MFGTQAELPYLNWKANKMNMSKVLTCIDLFTGNPRHRDWLQPVDNADTRRFKHLCKSYDLACSVYHEYGTGDSEPDGVIQQAVWDTWNGKQHGLKSCGKYWELYTASYDAETLDMVAARLVDNAMPIVHFLQSADRTPALEKAVCEFCWRFAQ
jgi:hypothetical protein